ncbi:hypothetical protein CDO44_07880 [Pigmentiphaga sp. NML080357]|nr:hypothetical protein CDO44_07880 [Pigmentiphaga sp. NML080357]
MTEEMGQGDGAKGEQIAAVQRALEILEALADAQDGMSFTDIVTLLDVNKAIAFKLINTLIGRRYVFRDETSGRYYLTFKMSNLGLRKMSKSLLLDQSNSILRELADATGELIRLAVVEGDTITWVSSILAQSRLLQLNPSYGFEVRLHLHAAGKAWLSTMSSERAIGLVLKNGLEPATEHSLRTVEAILEDLKVSAQRGYAISYEEHSLGVGAIGVPVLVRRFGEKKECVGVITMAAPCARMNRQALEGSAPRLLDAAARLASIWPVGDGRTYS